MGHLDRPSGTGYNGQIAKVESWIGATKQWEQRFGYDAVGRLKESREIRADNLSLTYKQVFDYDRFGNMYRKSANNATTGQQNPLPYTPIEETTLPNTGDIDKAKNRFRTGTTYDDVGNVVQDAKFRNQNLSYDANGRVVATSSSVADSSSTAVYDASGLRVGTNIDGGWTFFIYDAFGKMVAEYGGIPALDEGGVKYVFQDWQGSTRATVGNTGYVSARMDYTAFGESINAGVGQRTPAQSFNAFVGIPQKYALTERDAATGLDHTWFRKNESRAGRWTSPDPYNGSASLRNPQSFNRFSYVENQPTNFVDPSGLVLRYFDVDGGRTCVQTGIDENGAIIWHCTQHITRYWYDDGSGGGTFPEFNPGGGGGGVGSSTQNTQTLSSPNNSSAYSQADCFEDFKDKIIDIFAENALDTLAIAGTAAVAALLSGGTAAVIALIAAAVAGAYVMAKAMYKVYAADRDYQKCVKRSSQ